MNLLELNSSVQGEQRKALGDRVAGESWHPAGGVSEERRGVKRGELPCRTMWRLPAGTRIRSSRCPEHPSSTPPPRCRPEQAHAFHEKRTRLRCGCARRGTSGAGPRAPGGRGPGGSRPPWGSRLGLRAEQPPCIGARIVVARHRRQLDCAASRPRPMPLGLPVQRRFTARRRSPVGGANARPLPFRGMAGGVDLQTASRVSGLVNPRWQDKSASFKENREKQGR